MLEFKSKLGKVFTIRKISEPDHPEIFDLILNDFLVDEPITKSLPPNPDRYANLLARVKIYLSQNLSLLAIDQVTGRIAGFAINKIDEADKILVPPPKVLSPISQFFKRISKEVDLYKLLNVSIYGEIFILSTSQEYRGQGLGNLLFEESMKFLHESNKLRALVVVASNPTTRKIAARQGFKEEFVMKFSEFKDDNGTLIMPPEADGELVIASFVYASVD